MPTLAQLKKQFRNGGSSKMDVFYIKDFDPSLILGAVELAYIDAQRTFTGISSFWGTHNKSAFLASIANDISNAFSITTQTAFDLWHEKACDSLCDWLNSRGYKTAYYGQAQKIINMTFKYLYCLNGTAKYKVFKFCHMPLDLYTLKWYYCAVFHSKKSNTVWSKFSKAEYFEIVKNIRAFLKNGATIYTGKTHIPLPKRMLDAEFFVWAGMQGELD